MYGYSVRITVNIWMITERDKRRFKNMECFLALDVIPGKCSCWYLNVLFLLGNGMQCTQKTFWLLSVEKLCGLKMPKRADNVIKSVLRIAVLVAYQTKTLKNFRTLLSLMLKRKRGTANLFFFFGISALGIILICRLLQLSDIYIFFFFP